MTGALYFMSFEVKSKLCAWKSLLFYAQSCRMIHNTQKKTLLCSKKKKKTYGFGLT